MVREAKQEDLKEVLELYLCLHEKSVSEFLYQLNEGNHAFLVGERYEKVKNGK